MERSRTNVRVRPRGRRKSALRKFVLCSQICVLLCLGVGIGVIGGTFVSMSRLLPNITTYKPTEATRIISSDGILLGTVYEENREYVPLKNIPDTLKEATIAIEDERFYHHAGVDLEGVARAVFRNVKGGRMSEGGSTITQQLARNIYLTQRKTLSRKMQEAALAVLLERNYSKKKILELYLNQVYYGSGAYGVETASKIYFGKRVGDLKLFEAAMLAGLPQRPSSNSPHENLEAAVRRRNVVLNKMAELGKITPEERDEAKAEKARITPRKPSKQRYKAPYFVDYVVRQLSQKYGDDLIYRGGLRVYTTLNWEMQEKAEEAVRRGIARAASYQNVHQSALISIQPDNGYIRAMVGGIDYSKSQWNRTTQGPGRQPGSSFKAFVYTAAIDNGMSPETRILDAPTPYPDGMGGWWRPRNYDDRWNGYVTIRRAVAKSINIPAIKVADKVGVKEVIKYARLMGIKAKLEPYLPLAIGGIPGIHPIEMASAYGVFATKGMLAERISIVKITDSEGSIVEQNEPVVRRVLSARTAEIMDGLFRAVVTEGTGTSVRDVPEARGKTGTTNQDRDAWFIGYTPEPALVTAVWAGNDDNQPMKHVFGSTVCAPIWEEYTRTALKVLKKHKQPKPKVTPAVNKNESDDERDRTQDRIDLPPTDIRNADDTVSVRICVDSQLRATRSCPNTMSETFEQGTEPGEYCNVHGGSGEQPEEPAAEREPTVTTSAQPAEQPRVETLMLVVCSESGDLATRYCPSTKTEKYTSDNVPKQLCRKHRGTR